MVLSSQLSVSVFESLSLSSWYHESSTSYLQIDTILKSVIAEQVQQILDFVVLGMKKMEMSWLLFNKNIEKQWTPCQHTPKPLSNPHFKMQQNRLRSCFDHDNGSPRAANDQWKTLAGLANPGQEAYSEWIQIMVTIGNVECVNITVNVQKKGIPNML